MVRTRAQRVANDENGVAQSPQQSLSTPKRKAQKSIDGKSLNASIRDETRDSEPTVKARVKSKKSGTERSKQSSQSKAKTQSQTAAKKARLRKVAKQVKSQTENNVELPQDLSDIENHDSEDTENNGVIAVTSKTDRAPLEAGKIHNKTRAKDTTQISKPTKAAITNGEKTVTKSPVNAVLSASKPNSGLFDIFSRLSPQKLEPQSNSNEGVASIVNDKETSLSSEQPKITKSNKSKSKEQRALQEHGTNEQKPTTKKSSIFSGKRKRTQYLSDDDEEEEDLEDEVPRKKKTARWSFKPDHEGHLTLVPRAQIDPDDASVIFVEGQEAAKLISAEFERKKQVRFADRIAKQHPELTPEEKAAQHAEFEAQNLKLTTHGFFEKELSRARDARVLARKFDAGNKTMLEKVEILTTSDDQELRESLARDLMALAYAIRDAGPQSKDISPVERSEVPTWTNSQEDKENESAATSPENSPLQIEAPPQTIPTDSKSSQSPAPTTTPGRLFASIRKIRSYLPFGGQSIQPVQSPSEVVTEHVPSSPDSPTPAPRNENKIMQSSQKALPTAEHTGQSDSTPTKTDAPGSKPLFKTPNAKLSTQSVNTKGSMITQNGLNRTEEEKENQVEAQKRRAWIESNKKKIGSELYPLTPDGKIPRPAPQVWGINDAYFYEAEDSDDSDNENKEEPLPKRRRLTKFPGSISSRDTADKLRVTRSAPRPTVPRATISRPPVKTPAPRVISAPDYSSDSDSPEETPQISSVERREKEREKMRAERLKNSVDAHRPKTPSRLREMARAPRSPVDPKYRFRKSFKITNTQGVLNVFAHV